MMILDRDIKVLISVSPDSLSGLRLPNRLFFQSKALGMIEIVHETRIRVFPCISTFFLTKDNLSKKLLCRSGSNRLADISQTTENSELNFVQRIIKSDIAN